MKRITPLFLALLVATAAHAQSSEPVDLSSEEIIALIKGKNIATENTRWGSVSLKFEEDGIVYANGSNFSSSGKWKVVEGKLCMEGRRFDYEGCGAVRRSGEQIQHFWPSGSLHFHFRAL